MSEAPVSYTKKGKLALIRLERPEALNAITLGMIAAIERYARQAERDPEVIAICITGTGRGFCAGIDMELLQESARSGPPSQKGAPADRPGPPLFGFLPKIMKPVIGAINGVTAGGGFVLAMMCDLRFMAEEANITTVFSRRALIAEHGTSWLVPRVIGLSRALDVLWSSRKIDGAEAYRLGLADRVAPQAELLGLVEAYVADMAATVAPRMLAAMKAQVYRDLERPFEEAALDAARQMAVALKHPDAAEGALSFLERRAPRFTPYAGEKL